MAEYCIANAVRRVLNIEQKIRYAKPAFVHVLYAITNIYFLATAEAPSAQGHRRSAVMILYADYAMRMP